MEKIDFSRFGLVADVGGGQGGFLLSILDVYPTVGGLLFDLPKVVADTRQLHSSSPHAARLQFVAGSFFETMPMKADCIILKRVIHDWDDELSRTILRNCRDALVPGGSVLVIELLMNRDLSGSLAPLLDCNMLAITGGLERTEDEYAALFQSVGLQLVTTTRTACPLAIFEARLSGQ